MNIRIRPYRKNDAEKIAKWCTDEMTFYKWSAGILGPYPITAERMNEAVSARDDNDRFFPFVAFDENGIFGYFVLRHPTESLEDVRLGYILLDPKMRGKGYGKKMIQLALKYAFEIYGGERVNLIVFENNENAFACYKSIGFKSTGIVQEYTINGEVWKCNEMEIEKQTLN